LLLVGGVFFISGVAEWVNLSLPAILTGLCLWFKGTAGFQLQGFALLLIFLATPTAAPYIIAPYTFPLQSFIAHAVGFILNQFGMPVTVYGINVYVNGRIVEVAPYCAGLKMLFTSVYVSLILLYWTDTLSSRQIKIYFLSATVLISIIFNVIRNTLLSYFHGTGQEQAFACLHAGWGGELYSASVLLLLVPLLNRMSDYFLAEPEK
jgi:cyanoexosortase B